MEVSFTPQFRRLFRKLPSALQDEALDKIEQFKDVDKHPYLKVHKLKGRLADRFSFSVNYRYRILFQWEKQNVSALLTSIGDHKIYD